MGSVETYTVEFGRDGLPIRGYIVGRLSNGKRFVANNRDESTLTQLASTVQEPIGKSGWVHNGKDGRNLFFFGVVGKL